VSIAIDSNGEVVVTAPKKADVERLDKIVLSKATWIKKRLLKMSDRPPPALGREFISGETYRYLGRQYRLGEEVVPALVFELTGDDGRAQAVAIFEYFEQVTAGFSGERPDGEVVEDDDIDLGDAREQAGVGAVCAREAKLVEQARDAAVEHAVSFATGLVREGAREVGFSGAGRAGDDHGLVLGDPSARGELTDDGLFELPLAREVDALDAGIGDAELGVAEVLCEARIFAREHLGVDKQSEALVERQREGVGGLVLLEPCAGEDAQT
jgi:hypothetical protein